MIKNNEKIMEKSMQIWNWTKSVQKSYQNQFGEGLGLYLGGVWDRLGLPLGAFGRLLAAFWTFKIELFSRICPKWAPGGLLDGFWLALGRFWEGLGRVCGEIWEDFGPFEHTVGRFWKCLAWFRPAGADSLKWTPALIREASQCAGVLPLRVLN